MDEPKSIYDLAKLTGVSYATVSRVLTGNGRTSAATRRKVLQVADQYNFRPKQMARRTTVGLLIDVHDGVRQRYLSSVLAHLVERLSGHHVSIEIFTRSNLRQFRDCYVDAVIAMPWHSDVEELLQRLPRVPRLTINYPALPGCSTVASNHAQSGRMAAEYLLAQGHTRLGIIVATQDWGNHQRLAGFTAACAERGIAVPPALRGILCNSSPVGLVTQMLAQQPTALFIGIDDASIEVSSILHTLGVQVPQDLSLMSMENDLYSRFLQPPMTSISQQLETVVEKAADLIVKKVAAKDEQPEELLIDNILIERQSVAPLAPEQVRSKHP